MHACPNHSRNIFGSYVYIHRLRDTLFSHAGEVHSLERRQLELQTVGNHISNDVTVMKSSMMVSL